MKDSAVSSIYHDPSDLGIIDPHPDHPQGTHPKSHNWKASEQLAIYKHGQGVEVAYTHTMKQLQLVVGAGLDPRNSGFQVQYPNRSHTYLLCVTYMYMSIKHH